eukprot:CFRG3723T1
MTPSSRHAPVVLVHGFLGWGEDMYWSEGMNHHKKVIVAECGPVSSLHDRACELFYQLVGGRVDYGAEHSTTHGHSRYGRMFDTPAYPDWSSENPVHIVGHSAGGNTARVLQQYLHEKVFETHQHTGADWVRSLTTISSPHNGSPLAHTLGHVIGEPGVVSLFSVGWFATKLSHIYDVMDIPWVKKFAPDLHIDHWIGDHKSNMSWWERASILGKTLWKSPMFQDSVDNATYDMTPRSARDWNQRLANTFPCTYYFSFTASSTTQPSWSRHHYPSVASLLIPFAVLLGRSEYNEEDLLEMYGRNTTIDDLSTAMRPNDGAVPLLSQAHPHICTKSVLGNAHTLSPLTETVPLLHESMCDKVGVKCTHASSLQAHSHNLKPDQWHVTEFDQTDHFGIVGKPKCYIKQLEFFKELYSVLRTLKPVEKRNVPDMTCWRI